MADATVTQLVTENPQEFLMRTLSKDQWRVVAECLKVEVAEARADERERIAKAIEAEAAEPKALNPSPSLRLWASVFARIAREGE